MRLRRLHLAAAVRNHSVHGMLLVAVHARAVCRALLAQLGELLPALFIQRSRGWSAIGSGCLSACLIVCAGQPAVLRRRTRSTGVPKVSGNVELVERDLLPARPPRTGWSRGCRAPTCPWRLATVIVDTSLTRHRTSIVCRTPHERTGPCRAVGSRAAHGRPDR